MKRLAAVALALAAAACGRPEPVPPAAPAVSPSAALNAHSEEFRQELIEVRPGVHVAVGYGIANSILLEGTDGFIVVDTMETVEEARKLSAEFRTIVGAKPLKAIVYTHNHPDHTFGAAGFIQPGEHPVIYAHEKVNEALDSLITEFRPVINRRSLRMYGFWLSGDALGNVGIGPFLALNEKSTMSIVRPTKTFSSELEDTVAGIHFRLEHAPGETDDTLFMWIPEWDTLLPGDNVYKAFPNLYTIRGTTYRHPRKWADSLDRIRAVHPGFLVPSHGRPITGADTIQAVLTDYRDAIRYVYDQTVRAMNRGASPDEIASTLTLPEHLAKSPYLQQFYGKPSWSARMIFGGSVGWFDGNPAHLQPLAPADEAQRVATLAGGADGLRTALAGALDRQEWQWALQITDWLLALDRGDAVATEGRVRALTALGEAESNPNARHYYLMSATELREHRALPERVARPTPEMLAQMPLAAFFTGLSVNLDAQASIDRMQRVGFEFTDEKSAYTFTVRRGVTELQQGLVPPLDLHARMPAQAFKEMLSQLRSPAAVLASDVEMVKGNRLEFAGFLKLFQPETPDTP